MSCKLPLPSNECNGIVYFIGNLKKMLHFSSKLTRKENFDCSESDVRTTLCLHKCTWFWKFGKVLKCLLWLTVSCIRIKRVITPWSNFKVVDLRTPKSCLFFFLNRELKMRCTLRRLNCSQRVIFWSLDKGEVLQPVTPSPFERFFFSVNNKLCN